MSRDYRPIRINKAGKPYWKRCESWNVNAWGRSYYGHMFTQLGLPSTSRYKWMLEEEENKPIPDQGRIAEIKKWMAEFKNYPEVDHEFTGGKLQECRNRMGHLTDQEIRDAAIYSMDRMRQPFLEPDAGDGDVQHWREVIIPMFMDEKAISVASDYCDPTDIYQQYLKEQK